MIDLSQDQDHSTGPPSSAAEHGLISGKQPTASNSTGDKPTFKPGEGTAEQHCQSISMTVNGRPRRGRQEALQDTSAADPEAQLSTKKIQRHSKSGVEVEMEEI